MRPVLALALTGLLLTTGCSGSTGSETSATSATSGAVAGDRPGASSSPGGTTSGGPTPTLGAPETPTAAPGSCPVDAGAVAVFSRDWERVAGAVGREDVATYTKPFAAEVDSLAKKAAGCQGANRLPRLVTLARSIDAGAADGAVDLDDIAAFRREGNAWLEALGYGPDHLPTG